LPPLISLVMLPACQQASPGLFPPRQIQIPFVVEELDIRLVLSMPKCPIALSSRRAYILSV